MERRRGRIREGKVGGPGKKRRNKKYKVRKISVEWRN
jgi:hypothetical protein